MTIIEKDERGRVVALWLAVRGSERAIEVMRSISDNGGHFELKGADDAGQEETYLPFVQPILAPMRVLRVAPDEVVFGAGRKEAGHAS